MTPSQYELFQLSQKWSIYQLIIFLGEIRHNACWVWCHDSARKKIQIMPAVDPGPVQKKSSRGRSRCNLQAHTAIGLCVDTYSPSSCPTWRTLDRRVVYRGFDVV